MRRTAIGLAVISLTLVQAMGCEEEKAEDQAVDTSQSELEKPGPITQFRNQGAGSAPGNARRSAENVLNKAQQERARQFGEILDD